MLASLKKIKSKSPKELEEEYNSDKKYEELIETQAVVISDTHIFYSEDSEKVTNSKIEHIDKSIQKDKNTIIILNGDIFELIDIGKQKLEDVENKAIEYLKSLLEKYPNKKFIYNLGNHDCTESFYNKLCDLQKKFGNFTPEKNGVEIGKVKITHGDNELRADNPCYPKYSNLPNDSKNKFIERRLIKTEEHSNKLKAPETIINFINKFIVPLHDNLFHNPKIVIGRLFKKFKERNISLKGINYLIFSHTHIPFGGYEKNGVMVFNTGSTSNPYPVMFKVVQAIDQEGKEHILDSYFTDKQIKKFYKRINKSNEEIGQEIAA